MKKNLLGLLVNVSILFLVVIYTPFSESNDVFAEVIQEEKIEEYKSTESVKADDVKEKQRVTTPKSLTKEIKITSALLKIKSKSNEDEPVSFPNSKYRIWYTKKIDGVDKVFVVHEGVTNTVGEIKDVTLNNIPSDVTTLNFRLIMGNDDRGYIQSDTSTIYGVVFSAEIAENSILNFSNTSTYGGTEEEIQYCYLKAKLNYYFNDAMKEVEKIVAMANTAVPETTKLFDWEPINIVFQKGYKTTTGSVYYPNGSGQIKIPHILIGDNSSNLSTKGMKHSIIHEWLHYHMGKNIQTPGGSYAGHYGYNTNFQTSYKEGIALLFGDMYGWDYNYPYASYDTIVQRMPKAKGRSTNSTVYLVLADLVDIDNLDERVSLASHYSYYDHLSDKERKQLNLGMVYTIAMESRARTLYQFLQYFKENYVITPTDKAEFEELLSINSLSSEGYFTLKPDPTDPDNKSVPLSKEEIALGENGSK